MPGISSWAAPDPEPPAPLAVAMPATLAAGTDTSAQHRWGALPVPAASSASNWAGSVVQAPIGVTLLLPW
jgi:hypothetical protein